MASSPVTDSAKMILRRLFREIKKLRASTYECESEDDSCERWSKSEWWS